MPPRGEKLEDDTIDSEGFKGGNVEKATCFDDNVLASTTTTSGCTTITAANVVDDTSTGKLGIAASKGESAKSFINARNNNGRSDPTSRTNASSTRGDRYILNARNNPDVLTTRNNPDKKNIACKGGRRRKTSSFTDSSGDGNQRSMTYYLKEERSMTNYNKEERGMTNYNKEERRVTNYNEEGRIMTQFNDEGGMAQYNEEERSMAHYSEEMAHYNEEDYVSIDISASADIDRRAIEVSL